MPVTAAGYCEPGDLNLAFSEDEIDQVADRTTDGVFTADPDTVATAINDGAAQINSAIAKVVALPLTAPYPPILKTLNVDLARYRLYTDEPPPQVVERYKDALATLEQIRRGELSVVGADGAVVSTANRPSFFFDEKRFNRSKLRGY